MDIQTIRSFIWKWTKRVLYTFLGFFVIIILIAIFGPEEWKHPKIQNQTGSTFSGIVTNTVNIFSGSINTGSLVLSGTVEPSKNNTGGSNTGTFVLTGTNVLEKPKQTLDEGKRKEFYIGYMKVGDISIDTIIAESKQGFKSDLEKMKYYAGTIQSKQLELAKTYGLTENDIEPIIAEAIKKGWNTEYYNSTIPVKTTPISQKVEIQKYIDSHQGEIWVACKKEIQSQLKSPSTADFPFLDFTTWAGDTDITLKSYVDSQNGFGATIRTTFKCYFNYNNGKPSIKNVETL